jgi:hypothetical protein
MAVVVDSESGSKTPPFGRLKFTIVLVGCLGIYPRILFSIPPGTNNLALKGEVVGSGH